MTPTKATTIVSSALAITLAFAAPGWAQDPAADRAQQPDEQPAAARKNAPVEIELPVEDYAIARLDVVEDTSASDKTALVASYVHFGAITLAGSSGDVILTSTGWNFVTSLPRSVQVQARQGVNNPNTGYPDQFSIQVLSTTPTSIKVRVRRMDDGVGSSGWGQVLRLDFMVIP